MSSEAYLEIRDICKDNNCVEPKVFQENIFISYFANCLVLPFI